MGTKIYLKDGEDVEASQIDLSIDGWVVAESKGLRGRETRRFIPRENIEQISAWPDSDVILPSREE